MEGYQRRGGGMREKAQGIRSINGSYKIDRGRIRNGEAKELICTTHGQELREGNAGGRGDIGGRRIKGRKWDNYNSIINKIYLK